MKTVEETRLRRGTSYEVRRADGQSSAVNVTCSRIDLDGREVFVFYDSDVSTVLMEPSKFVTEDLRWESVNTRLQAVSAMRLLFDFCEIVDLPFRSWDLGVSRAFMQFMRGLISDGVECRFRLVTVRSEGTVAAYLKYVRRFAKSLHLEHSPFLEAGKCKLDIVSGSTRIAVHRLSADVRESYEAPMYISLDEYRRVLDTIESSPLGSGDPGEARAIVRLMFEHGLRIGEVLGLTLEDLSSSSDRNGLNHYSVVLRNRCSDREWQSAKTLMPVTDKRQYRSVDYRKLNVGRQVVYISEDLYFCICEYLEGTERLRDAHPDRSEADSVKGDGGNNEYIFLNSLGRPLSQNLWDKRLRTIMLEAGLSVDEGKRKTNLNHRFRHGFGMFLQRSATNAKGNRLDAYEVMHLMRHRSLSSTDVYMKPTEDDIRDLQESITGEIEKELFDDAR